ncbi:MAG: hypothetical protein CL459_02735 [Acidimicrobiaceae bacterium]|nr:hypothetical protein [Acidimicrobiaceae bacterium]
MRRSLLLIPLALAACGGSDEPGTRNAALPSTTSVATTTAAPTTTSAPTTTAAPTTSSTTTEPPAIGEGISAAEASALDDHGSGRALGIAYGYDAAYGYDVAYGYDAAYGGDCAYGYARVGDYDCIFGRYYISAEAGSVVLAMSVFFTLTVLGGMGTMAWQALRREPEAS